MNDENPKTAGHEAAESGAEITRRRFLTFVFGVASALGLGAFAAPLARYAYPVLKGEVFARIQVATMADLEPLGEGIEFDYQDIPSHLIQLADGGYAAFSMICPHLGCIVKWMDEEDIFHCPCHAAEFSPEGDVVAGPPPRPLDRLVVVVEGQNIFVEGFEQVED